MNVVNRTTLDGYAKAHRSAAAALLAWWAKTTKAQWRKFEDVRAMFRSADLVPNPNYHALVIFDIGGNQWRLATDVNFRTGRVYLRWFGTHAEYDKVDWRNFP